MFRMATVVALVSGVGLIGLAGFAFAGEVGVPAPIVGAGLPLLLAAGGVYVAVKLIRTRGRG